MNGGGKVACVTGASGYVASWIVKLLLLRGYTVRATVRNPTDTAKTEHLLALDGADERLKLFKADLLEEYSFEQAIEGCEAVFHTASPVKFIVTDPQTELIDPALKGTMNVLNTCKKTSSVKRVIVTSSMAAVIVRQPPLEPNDVVDESFFSDPSVCMETEYWYPLSKTLAENVAWQFSKDNGMDMVFINPGFVIGPLLQPTLNFSVEMIVDMINEMNGGGKVVCVTGASGYIASWIVKLLLLRGYTVRATVRNPTDTAKTEHLLALEGAKERLKLFKADLLEECSFEQAIEGCDAVFHTASPVKYIVTDPQTELIDPAVKGTLNVLNTCKKTSSVKRVILTSSTAAVLVRPLEPKDVVDETFFSDPSVCTELKLWYPLCKTLAENAAWQFTKDNGMDMVVINPGFIIGPLLQPTLNFSVEIIVDMVKGKNPFNFINYRFVDVRDVALAHVKALEILSANGRYLIDGPSMTINEIRDTIHELIPDLCIADMNGESEMKEIMTKEIIYEVCVEKVKTLGVEFTPLESSLRDTIISLKEKCLL
ncbi:unnamed protein product [Brassica oleracea var. botrytis]